MTHRTHAPALGATVLGYPRIGPDRELKRALEAYWAGRIDAAALHEVAATLRAATWTALRDAGLGSVPSNTFSYYDQVLDTAVLVDALPARYTEGGRPSLDAYFAAARGADSLAPLELTKWFDTNYHYLVPELGPDTVPRLAGRKPVEEFREAAALGITTRPVLLGPVTFLLLSKAAPDAPAGFDRLDLLDAMIDTQVELLAELAAAGAEWVQFDEPAFAADRTPAELDALAHAYRRLGEAERRPSILVAGYHGALGDALGVLAAAPIEAVGLDLVAGRADLTGIASVAGLRQKTLLAGVVDGRNVWRTDLDEALAYCAMLLGIADHVTVGTSAPLLHVPYDLDAETGLDPALRSRLAFARQKVDEVVLLAKALGGADEAAPALEDSRRVLRARDGAATRDQRVRARLESLRPEHGRRADYDVRARGQAERLGLPPLATTTIGSFPQTGGVRRARADRRAGRIDEAEYRRRMRAEIADVIALQEDIGLDVLVHGEPERNDMVQYFAENLEGFLSTEHGWVQSYGSRCVRPPIIHGDVSRPAPMTVEWSSYAQSLTERPVKGMLTGPVTILAWSFVRDDQPLGDTARQVALALRDEIHDLERAGLRIVQVDEPALRELLPLREADRADYLAWAVDSFRLATSGAADSTQIHTHLCYSEFGDVIDAIDALDADVTTIEAARSRMEVLDDLHKIGYRRGVGPGVYDIHSPRVPDEAEVTRLIGAALAAVPGDRLWVNPDCGLKTRGYAEVEPALRAMVSAARARRAQVSG
ncbi:5-methyltetrahydropteroyltriglutamate--homocysteine methyltransferase [Actinoalloteichus hoggarensis]|uniref:5-methyltetrahydropteroyltriglutamate--homocysteine methyltransferase n=1 Tax=Actinoalloteichus hoggarensis TaxID=1470176 RepID=A0A221W249_9PSEU|nr:5-methyltetrahydropteroyltriglutamate--homocysteine S-methyltransferase [Actinoalloteichus hoggarensis]ASO19773.1 5-methyltetrahydropteroyltriglutamate--homocysteine methyltransferase [Actinoalloteichus hoggarensis]MBB5919520.1 5-methyltetrahydropteroyltriglutamate--homocysteine methyltransferase [Actinoalloteichus hoggarensis]